MITKTFRNILRLALISVLMGCAPAKTEPAVVPATSTLSMTATPASTATPALATRPPTMTPLPTHTPNMAATQRVDDFSGLIQEYHNKGYTSTADGEITSLDSFRESWAQMGWYQWWLLDDDYADFVFKAHFKWSTSHPAPTDSGCGIVFGFQENQDHYAIFLDKSRILFLMARGSHVYEVGKTRGSGRVSFDSPAEADFVAVVKGQSVFVSINDEVTEYTLSVDQSSAGGFGFTLLSGTNRDYGTRCEMTDIMLWTPKK